MDVMGSPVSPMEVRVKLCQRLLDSAMTNEHGAKLHPFR